MLKQIITRIIVVALAALVVGGCGGKNAFPTLKPIAAPNISKVATKAPTTSKKVTATANTPVADATTSAPATLPSVSNGETGGEGGVEAALVTYADAAQHFSIGYPGPWTRDPSVAQGVKFVGGDSTMTLEFATLAAGTDAMQYAQKDAAVRAFNGYKEVGLAPSTEVANAIVLGFEAQGKSAVTGKAFAARGDRYYMPLANGRVAILTVVGPTNLYDREGVRDIALTFRKN